MNRGILCCASLIVCLLISAGHAADYMMGADVSFLAQAEQRGRQFKDKGQVKPGLQIFKDHGYNWIRLRLFHTPTQLPNNLQYTMELAKRARQMGYKFFLDFHYSDTWADPGKQFIPAAWEEMNHEQLVAAVEAYTRDTIAALRDGGAMPDMVQIGNEITPGMLWPDGRLSNSAPDRNWKNFSDLLKAGVRGVEAGKGDAPMPKICIHIDKGGDRAATKYFFEKCNAYGVPYDVVGLSYYPFWHGSLMDLRDNLAYIATELNKDAILAEVAYNWRPTQGNEGYGSRPAPFPETPEGQAAFYDEVNRIVMQAPNNRGKGVFWWEPAVAAGGIARRGMFDDEGNALPVVYVFDKWSIGKPGRVIGPGGMTGDAAPQGNFGGRRGRRGAAPVTGPTTAP
jgi:arabinogalactan endo-1,4-beta-galactosidase